MKRIIAIMAATLIWPHAFAEQLVPVPETENRVLMIDLCSTSVPGGKATLMISPLKPKSDVFGGDYQMKVTPYFFKGESGKLAINVPREAFAKAAQGMAVDITGTATSHGETKVRHIDATATPADSDHGALTLSFLVGDRKMVFNTSYHIVKADLVPASPQ